MTRKGDPSTAMSLIPQHTSVGSTEATNGATRAAPEDSVSRDTTDAAAIDDPLVVAAEKVVESEDPLLTTEVQEVAAQVSEENPFGVPGLPLSERSPLRFGFSAGIGLLLAAAVGVTVVFASRVLILLLVAAIIATGLEPVVDWLCHRGFRRGVAVAAVVVTLVGLFGAFLAQVVPVVTSETSHFIHQLPTFLHDLQKKNTELGRLNLKYHLQEKAKNLSTAKLAGGALHLGGIVVSAVAAVLVVLVLVVYFLADFPTLKRTLYRMAPGRVGPVSGSSETRSWPGWVATYSETFSPRSSPSFSTTSCFGFWACLLPWCSRSLWDWPISSPWSVRSSGGSSSPWLPLPACHSRRR